MSIQLTQTDFDRLRTILEGLPEWRTQQARIDLLDEVFAASPRRLDVLRVSLDGGTRQAAVRVIQHLAQFGQDLPGREALLALTGTLLKYVGEGPDAAFLRELAQRYPANSGSDIAIAPGRLQVDRVAFRDWLVLHFGSKEELEALCFSIQQRLHNNGRRDRVTLDIVGGDGLEARCQRLIEYLDRRGLLTDLVAEARGLRPDVDWP